ncbi:serotriflin-like [Eublepharis macularius]|uniref:Serotriflin-like n=1 Tax=Eublepharis macularius TaxID=481883 RepID=A0AA97KTE8_EUBMA|nr:serotriflin-like [Eublepharis macularius]
MASAEAVFIISLQWGAGCDESTSCEEEEDEEDEEEENTFQGTNVSPEDQKEIVDKLNEIRRNVKPSATNMLKVIWNETMAESAKKWADECKLTVSPDANRRFNRMMCSENIFYTNFPSTWTNAIEAWEKRKAYFNYGVGATDTSRSIASYTQLIWYNSYQVGCGIAYCPGDISYFYYVCQYCPPANREDLLARPYKKGPSCNDCPNACENKLCTNPCLYRDTTKNCRELKQLYSCKIRLLRRNCKATCRCKTEII